MFRFIFAFHDILAELIVVRQCRLQLAEGAFQGMP
jgi:hypothetical protein